MAGGTKRPSVMSTLATRVEEKHSSKLSLDVRLYKSLRHVRGESEEGGVSYSPGDGRIGIFVASG